MHIRFSSTTADYGTLYKRLSICMHIDQANWGTIGYIGNSYITRRLYTDEIGLTKDTIDDYIG